MFSDRNVTRSGGDIRMSLGDNGGALPKCSSALSKLSASPTSPWKGGITIDVCKRTFATHDLFCRFKRQI